MASKSAEDIAAEVLACLDDRRQRRPFSAEFPQFSEADAYVVTARLRDLRVARGERPVGRKIGFTNRNIWPEYNVFRPIWGDVYDTTVHDLADMGATIRVSHLPEPRIEPEIVLGLAKDIAPDAGLDTIAAAIGWVAHGFEIVQSIFPNWSFSPADTVAAYGLHGGLYTGPWHDITGNRDEWFAKLPAFEIDLYRNGELADHGQASNVLDGPLTALKHLIDVLAVDPNNPQIAAGEIVTTGTLTRAFPVVPGETWSTRPGDIPFEGISITFR